MTKVWLITSGEYSDYEVHFAALSEEIAKAYCEQENAQPYAGYRQYEYEEIDVMEAVPPPGKVEWWGEARWPSGKLSFYAHRRQADETAERDVIRTGDMRFYTGVAGETKFSGTSLDRERLERLLKQAVVDHWANKNTPPPAEAEDGASVPRSKA